MTWLLVRMYPSDRMTSPDPVPLPPLPRAAMVTTDGMTLFATEVTSHTLSWLELAAAARRRGRRGLRRGDDAAARDAPDRQRADQRRRQQPPVPVVPVLRSGHDCANPSWTERGSTGLTYTDADQGRHPRHHPRRVRPAPPPGRTTIDDAVHRTAVHRTIDQGSDDGRLRSAGPALRRRDRRFRDGGGVYSRHHRASAPSGGHPARPGLRNRRHHRPAR